MWHGVPEYLAVVAAVAVILHVLVRRWLAACAIGTVFCSTVNLVHEAWLVNFKVNIGWAPFEFVSGCVRGLAKVLTVSLWYAITFNFLRMRHLGII
jgi:hypothetical protein